MFVINLDFFVDFIDIFQELLYKQKLYNILVFYILGNFENKILLHTHLDLFFLLLHHNVNSQVFSTRKAQSAS